MTEAARLPLANCTARRPRIALAHDWLVGMRGGEWVLDRLARLFGPTTIHTLVHDGRPLTPAIDRCTIITSPLQHLPHAAGKWRRRYLPLMPWAVGQLRVDGHGPPSKKDSSADDADGADEEEEIGTRCADRRNTSDPSALSASSADVSSHSLLDLLISTSSAVMKSIRPPAGGRVPHLCYCHSPARYIWEQGGDYALGRGGIGRALGLALLRPWFQAWDRRTAQDIEHGGRVTKFLANSHHTAARIKRCYGREATVVYPPVRIEFFTPDPSIKREDWLLVVAALEPYKRTEIVIEASNRAGFRLKIAGDGSQRDALAALAGPTVEMLGRVDDQTLRDLYRRAKALVFPQVEDFGIIAVEAQACGCPVIAFDRGGARETVTAETGILFEAQTPEAVIAAVQALESRRIDPVACRMNAERFSETAFDQAILREVDLMMSRTARAGN